MFLGLDGRMLMTPSGASCWGSSFQVVGAVKETDLRPKVLVMARGLDNIRESVDERRDRAGT